jgi:hypothetical protein
MLVRQYRTTQSRRARVPVPLSFHTPNRTVTACSYILSTFHAHAPPHEADMQIMYDRRIEPRMLCAELVELRWRDKQGFARCDMAHLEDISLSGASLQAEKPLLRGTALTIHYGNGELVGTVRYCLYRDWGYFLGVEFTGPCKWSSRHFKPQHLLDPRTLVARASRKPFTRPN